MKLWQKETEGNEFVIDFTSGSDREMDLYLAPFDILGSMAHAKMLNKIGILTNPEIYDIRNELVKMYQDTVHGDFSISNASEDIHTEIENRLTRALGNAGKKIHTGRSRNDQVLLDIRLFTRNKLILIRDEIEALFTLLQQLSENNKDKLMPGYTHLQVAMPSSFGLWFGAYAESLIDDLSLVLTAYQINNQNPLGSAAGYGSSFPIDRSYTTKLLGFDDLSWNVVYAQMSRGKTERTVAFALSNLASSIAKMSGDICLYMSQNFGFIHLPDNLTTGSSIMPHKKNPDLFEIIRAKCNQIQSLPYQIGMLINNLPSGYFRDMQLVKEIYLPSFDHLISILKAFTFGLQQIQVNNNLLDTPLYDGAFTVEKVNQMVRNGMAFRDAYRMVAKEVESGVFIPEKNIQHTHEGSIGNLCNKQIKDKFDKINSGLNAQKITDIEKALLGLNKETD